MMCSVSKDPKAPQLTIFYGGQVHVFDEFPAEKAKEIISFASSNVTSQNQNMSAYSFTQNLPSSPPNVVASSADSRTQINTKVNIITSNVANNLVLEPQNAIPLPRLPRPNIAGNFLLSLVYTEIIEVFGLVSDQKFCLLYRSSNC